MKRAPIGLSPSVDRERSDQNGQAINDEELP